MTEIDIQPTAEDIRGILLVSPIWDSLLWDAIQEGDYDSVESRFKDLLKGEYSSEEWGLVYWDGILSGIETFREDVDILAWNSLVLPALSRGILKAATPSNLELIYRALPLNRARSFYSLLISSIPEKGGRTKSDWLKDENLDLFRFLNANPGGLSFSAPTKSLGIQRGIERVQILPENLSSLLFSAETAKTINQLGEENKLSEEQTHNIATICGDVILGIIKFSDIARTIQEKNGMPEDKSLSLLKSLEEKILAPIKKDIEASYAIPASTLQPLKESSSGNRLEVITINENQASKEVTQLPSSLKPPSTSIPIIPKTLNQQPESFFKSRPTEPKKTGGEPAVGPIIIHQETKAESLATAPKLGFRTSENKLPGAKDRPEPLRAVKLTMSGGPDSHAPGREDDTNKHKVEGIPVLPLGAKFTIPKISNPSLEKDAPKESSSGFLGKIKNVFSKEEVQKVSPLDTSKTSVPTPPTPPTTTSPLAQLQNISTEKTPPASINIPIKREEGMKPVVQNPILEKKAVISISPLPVVQKEKTEETILPKPTSVLPPTPPAKIPTINPVSVPVEKAKSSILPQPTPITPPKIDLKKMADISIKEIPPSSQEKKPGFFSRLFKGAESKKVTTFAEKEIPAPISMPTAKAIPQINHTPSPLPPAPPAPVQSASLPKNISGLSAQPLPTQKISPLIGFKEKGNTPSNIPLAPQKLEEKDVVKTSDIIATSSKVVNYSEYPVSEKTQN